MTKLLKKPQKYYLICSDYHFWILRPILLFNRIFCVHPKGRTPIQEGCGQKSESMGWAPPSAPIFHLTVSRMVVPLVEGLPKIRLLSKIGCRIRIFYQFFNQTRFSLLFYNFMIFCTNSLNEREREMLVTGRVRIFPKKISIKRYVGTSKISAWYQV